MNTVKAVVIAGLVIGLGAALAWSQMGRAPGPLPSEKPVSPAPVAAATPGTLPAQPQSTSATFGDWVLHCERVVDGTPLRVCETAQAITGEVQQEPIAQVAFGRPAANGPVRLTLLLPPNVTIATRPKVGLDEKDSRPFELTWRRCLSAGCFATMNLTDDDLHRLRTQTTQGRIMYVDAGNRDLAIPLSWHGLPQALDAMDRS